VSHKQLINKHNLYNVRDKTSLDKLKTGFVCFSMLFTLLPNTRIKCNTQQIIVECFCYVSRVNIDK